MVPVVDASTVMLLGDDPRGGLKVLLLKRNVRLEFVGGAFVFPGGKIDPEDRSARSLALCDGLSDADASTMLGVDHGGLGFWFAAVRECFEEAGVLLGRATGEGRLATSNGSIIDTSDPMTREIVRSAREALNAKEVDFCATLEQLGVRVACDALHYFAHWITPEGSPRRYDTRFFLGMFPLAQRAEVDDSETVLAAWISPTEALNLHKEGTFEMILPTIKNLEAIERFESAADAVAVARRVNTVETVLPKLIRDSNGIRILLPWDPTYNEAVGIDMLGDETLPLLPPQQ